MSLLEQQAQAHRQKHGLPEKASAAAAGKRQPPPSILFSPQEAKWHDAEAFAALGRHGIAEASLLDPDIAACASLFEGRQHDRETLTRAQNEALDKDIRHLLCLLSPHLQSRAAQECIDALLHRYHAHRWNVDDLLSCALPYHDSPLFTRLLQGLQIEGKPRWAWLQPLKEKPATLVRSALAKYCGKDLSVLTFIGGVLQESVKLHKLNRALSTFFASVWLDTLAAVKTVSTDLVEAALPAVLTALRRPQLRDSFHAALAVVAALCVKAELEGTVRAQLLERAAKQVGAEQGQPAAALITLLFQLQAVDGLSERALRSLAAAGPQAVVDALPLGLDCENILFEIVEHGLFLAATNKDDADRQTFQELVNGLLANKELIDCYTLPLALAALQAFCRVVHNGDPKGEAGQRATVALKAPIAAFSKRNPMALGMAFRKAADAAAKSDMGTEPLMQLFESTPGAGAVTSSPSIPRCATNSMPLMEALMHGAVEVKLQAVKKAVKELQDSRDDEEDAWGQRLLVSLVLQAVEDESVEVADCTLSLKTLWTGLPQVEPASAAQVLHHLLSSRWGDVRGKGNSLKEITAHVLLEGPISTLLPAAMRCFAWVYGRSDSGAALRQRIDGALLPLLILCLVGLDLLQPSSGQDTAPQLSALQAAMSRYCAASEHSLLSCLRAVSTKGGRSEGGATVSAKGPYVHAVAQAVSATDALILCRLVEARPWLVGPPAEEDKSVAPLPPLAGMLGGAAAQAAAATLLAHVLPHLLENLGCSPEAEQLASRCTEVCLCFAWHQSLVQVGEGDCLEVLRNLFQATLLGLCSVEGLRREAAAKGGAGASEGGRRRSRGSTAMIRAAKGGDHFRQASLGLLQLALDRPQSFAAELRRCLSEHLLLLRPALLALALGPDARTPAPSAVSRKRSRGGNVNAASANALLLVRSLFLAQGAPDITLDQSVLAPLIVRLASAEGVEVRAAALEVMDALRSTEACEKPSWDSPCAAALREAGVLRATTEVLPAGVWAAAQEQELELAGLSGKAFSSVMEQIMAHKAEILQDPSGAALALSKSLIGKGSAGRTARTKACAFWGVSLAMLAQDATSLTLLPAIPAAGLLMGLAELLRAAMEGTLAGMQGCGRGIEEQAPLALRVAAVRMLGLARRRANPTAQATPGEQPRAAAAAEEEVARNFMEQVALPFCRGLADFLVRGGGKPLSDSVVDLACLICKSAASMATWPSVQEGMRLEVVSALFNLSVAASAFMAGIAKETGEAEDTSVKPSSARRLLTDASTVLLEVPLDAKLLQRILLEHSVFKGQNLETLQGHIAAEMICKQVSGLKGAASSPGSGGTALLISLTEVAFKVVGSRQEESSDSHLNGLLEQLLMAAAALSEHLQGQLSGGMGSQREEVAAAVVKVCGNINELSKALGQCLSGGILLAIIRTCGALAPLVQFAGELQVNPQADEQPMPLQCCIQALSNFPQPLRPDILSMLKAHLQRLWRCPEVAKDAVLPGLSAQWDLLAQARLRVILSTVMLEKTVLLEQVDAGLCLSLALNAGTCASLDFVMLLYLARRGPATVAGRRKAPRKKRRNAERESFAQELLNEVLPPQDDAATVDELLEMMMSIGTEGRYHCLGTLMQTLSALTLGLCPRQKGGRRRPALPWGPALLPEVFLQSVDADRALWVLDMGLQVASRFVSEHGLPDGLDESGVRTQAFRATAVLDEEAAEQESAGAALALGYTVLSVCLIEVLLEGKEEPRATACCAQARQLKSLLLRSLAVNHPLTFFQSVGLALQVPDLCPEVPTKGLFADEVFMALEAEVAMVGVKEALHERRDLHEKAGGEGTIDEEAGATCASLCTMVMRHTNQHFLAGAAGTWPEDLAMAAWCFLDALCRFAGSRVAQPVLELYIPASAGCLRDFAGRKGSAPSVQVAVECCSSLETAIVQLGHGLLERLDLVAEPLLACAGLEEVIREGEHSGSAPLQKHALLALQALVKSLGSFLSPFLERVLFVVSTTLQPWKTQLAEALGQELVARVPHRLLLPAVLSVITTVSQRLAAGDEPLATAAIDLSLVQMQRFGAVLVWIFSQATAEFTAEDADGIAGSLLRLLATGGKAASAFLRAGGELEQVPTRLLQRDLADQGRVAGPQPDWAVGCSKASVFRLNELAGAAFAQFALRFTVDSLKPRFASVLEWARNTQAHTLERQAARRGGGGALDLGEDSEDVCRLLALCAAMQGLAAEAPDIVEELLLPLATSDLACCLGAVRRCALQLAAQRRPSAKKRRRSGDVSGPRASSEALKGTTWWWFDVAVAVLRFISQALRPAGSSSTYTKAVEEAVEALLEPLTAVLDVFEFAPPSEELDISATLLQAVQGALVMVGAAANTAHMKRLLSAILSKSRADDAEVRLNAVRCCHKIWKDLGVQAASGLSEVVMYASELLEDEDPRVEAAVRLMVKTIEECTGENLQDALKH